MKATISVNVNWRRPDGTEDPEDDIELENDPEPSEASKKVPYFRYVLSYNHPLSPQKKRMSLSSKPKIKWTCIKVYKLLLIPI